MMKANWYVLGAVCLLLASVATAQLDDDGSPAGQSAGLPSEDVQPEVTIVERDDGVVYEYRVKGQLYMAKVVPTSGPSYYLGYGWRWHPGRPAVWHPGFGYSAVAIIQLVKSGW